MSGETVADIVVGKQDAMGLEILTVYHKVDRIYAVYANRDRMVVKYADDEELASKQRLALSHLAPLRGEINGLLDDWRDVSFFSLLNIFHLSRRVRSARETMARLRARRYDRRVADALVVALQGDQASAELVLAAIKQDITDERVSVGRVQHVGAAGCLAFLIFLLFGLMHHFEVPSFVKDNDVWLATGLGCLGAFFSIAIAIRDRSVHTDLRTSDNVIDAGLRILIGAISAVVLFSIFRSEILSISIGGGAKKLCSSGEGCSPDYAVVIGFLAGFSERLVGDLLNNKLVPMVANATLTTSAAATAAAAADLNRRATANETNPLGKTGATSPPDGPGGGPEDGSEPDEEDHEHGGNDDCLCDEELTDHEITSDVELPPASGGVEQK